MNSIYAVLDYSHFSMSAEIGAAPTVEGIFSTEEKAQKYVTFLQANPKHALYCMDMKCTCPKGWNQRKDRWDIHNWIVDALDSIESTLYPSA